MSDSDEYAGQVAIIGMAGRFPGARDVAALWRNIVDGRSGLVAVDADDLRACGEDPTLLDLPDYVAVTGALDDVECFDAALFGYSAREAELLDPQHRHFLEVCWAALESAGYNPTGIGLPVGVFAGARVNTYLLENLLPQRSHFDQLGLLGLLIGNDKDFLATNVSYRLGLTGPSLTVQTACSTSLVATHLACQSLITRECDLAVAGGSAIAVPHRAGYRYLAGGIYSPDGRCRPFAADANGTVGGSGVAAVVLRRLDDALADGDPIQAVILGSAVNNDGRAKIGFTAPGVEGQTRVIAEALAVAGVPADTVGYVETHGTGTSLGDPIEVAALTAAYRADTDHSGFCALGSVKATVGHLDAAAGVTGLITAALAVRSGIVPPSPHAETVNPAAQLEQSPFFVPTSAAAWPLAGPRRAGVSSFGIGGTNAHVILGEAPGLPASARPAVAEPEVIVVSARTSAALRDARDNLARTLGDLSDEDRQLSDVAVTLHYGRTAMRHRVAVAARTPAEAAALLAAATPETLSTDDPQVVFLFPGQGSQRPGTGAELYAGEPEYRAAVDRCAELLMAPLGFDIRHLLHADPGDTGAAAKLRQTELAQPALFVVEYAAATLLRSWGVRPHALVGHSLGEYVSATLADALPLEDALSVVTQRGQLMQSLPTGAMLAVLASVDAVADFLDGDVSLAAVNAPTVCVLSGPAGRLAAVSAALTARGVATRPLATSHAFHSSMMDAAVDPLRSAMTRVRFDSPTTALTSGLTGDWLRPEQLADPDYWAAQLRQPVRFADALRTATAKGSGLLVELGPGRVLSGLAKTQVATGWRAVPGLGELGDRATMLAALGAAWCVGVSVDWAAVRAGRPGRRMLLPTYPFERQRHWIEPPTTVATHKAQPITAGRDAPVPEQSTLDRDALATIVAAIWSELLGVTAIAGTDDFYDLGGHSLLAAQVLARLRTRLGVHLTIDRILGASTLEELTSLVRSALPTQRSADTTVASVTTVASGTIFDTDADTDADDVIRPVPRHPDGMALSPPQQRLWVLEQLDPGTAVYHLPVVLRLRGSLDVAALSRALSTVVGRHEALRSRFTLRGGAAVQHVSASPPVALTAETATPTELDGLVHNEICRPFDLAVGPPVRLRLLRLNSEEHLLTITMHHLVVDGWSIGVLVDELVRCYHFETAGAPTHLAPVTLHCADVAAFQTGRSVDPQALAFWAKALGDVDAPLQLPADRARPSMASGAGGRVRTYLPEKTLRSLTAVAGESGATLYMALLAGLGALLSRLGGQSRVVIGTPVANRLRPELEHVVGLLANTLPVPVDVGGDPTFRELLGRVRDSTLGVLRHQDVPYERIVAHLAPDRELGHNPLFSVMLAVQNAPLPPLRLPGLSVEPVDVHTATAKFDLTFDATPVDEQLRLSLEYSADMWDEATAESLLDRFAAVLGAVAAEPEMALHALPVLSDAAREQLSAWGDGGEALPETTVVALVARQIDQTPDVVAVTDGVTTLTYAELDSTVDKFAGAFAVAGVSRGDRVALCLPRDARGVAVILAVLRLGAAYVPLDVSYPVPRLEAMLRRSGARFLVTSDGRAPNLATHGHIVIDLDAARMDAARMDAARMDAALAAGPRPDDLVYVVFTSGSTGEPKGIGLPHRALANLVQWQVNRSALPAGARTAQLTPYSFDVHFQEIFGTLAGGGTLVVIPDELRRDPAALVTHLDEQRVRRLFLPYVLLASLVDAARRIGVVPTELTEVVTAGEQLQITEPVRRFFRQLRGAVLDNHYGPAETHVTTAEPLRGDPDSWPNLPAIGRPLPGVQAYIADPSGAPAGVDTPGELWLSGVALAPGYLDDENATAERFVTHWADPRRRAYRTGDVVRWSHDGRLIYLGRADAQVKVRGHRVEPAEIEAVLSSHAAVRECAVVPRSGPNQQVRLIGYIVPSDVDIRELRMFLTERVPPHLVPTQLVAVDAMPRTPSGKVDRRRLPDPPTVAAPAGTHVDDTAEGDNGLADDGTGEDLGDSAGGTRVDDRVARAWHTALGVEVAAGAENFFDVGGDSILAIALSAAVSDAGLPMAPRDVFEHQTPADLTTALLRRAAVAAQAGHATRAVAASPAMLALRSERPRTLWLTSPSIDADRLVSTLRQIVARHAALRSRLRPPDHNSPFWTIVTPADQDRPLWTLANFADFTGMSAGDAEAAAGRVADSLVDRLDPVHGPVFAAAVCRCPTVDRLVLAAHPCLVDDDSWQILLDDLHRAYANRTDPALAAGPAEDLGATGAVEAAPPALMAVRRDWASEPGIHRIGRGSRVRAIAGRHHATEAQVVTALLVRALVHTGHTVLVTYRGPDREAGIDPRVGQFGTVVRLTESASRARSPFPAAATLRAVKQAADGGPDGVTDVHTAGPAVEIHEIGVVRHGTARTGPGATLAPTPQPHQIQWWRDGEDIWLRLGAQYGGEFAAANSVADDIAGATAELANAGPAQTVTPTDYPLAAIGTDELTALMTNGVPVDLYPLTPMQRTMLTRERSGSRAGLFAVRTVDALPSAVDPVALRDAFAAAVARHPILRTSFWFGAAESAPLQVVHASVDLPWTELDWRDIPATQLRDHLDRFLAKDFAIPFDLGRAPLLRFTLIRLPGGGFQLIFTGHHLLTDGWSRAILLKDVPALYAAALAARPWPARLVNGLRQAGFAARLLSRSGPDRPRLADLLAAARPDTALPPVPRPFRDHVAMLADENAEAAQRYWATYLSPVDGVVAEVPGEPDGAGYRRCAGALPAVVAERLGAAARASRVTVAAMAQAAWAVVLARHTGAAEVMFGVTSSGRRSELAGYDRMVGLFITTLPQRARLDPNERIADLVRTIQADAALARRHDQVALIDLERAHAVRPGLLFDTVVVVDNFPQDMAQHRLGAVLRTGHPFAEEHFDLGMTEFGLRLEVIPVNGLGFALCHHREHHGAAQADALLAEFATVLVAIGQNMDRPVAELLRAG